MNLENLLLKKRDLIYRLAKKHGAYNVRIFGSVARKEADADVILIFWSIWNLGAAFSILADF
jgi:predicted nucleotidyltransferase